MFERSCHDVRAGELLKVATARKKEKDWDGAIAALTEAYQEIAQSELVYSIDTFIRLPQLLQLAGRSKDGWREFNRLLLHGFANQLGNDQVRPMERSILFDKMRLFLLREQQDGLAAIFSIFAAVSWNVGLYRQNRLDELAVRSFDQDAAEMISALTAYSNPGTIQQFCDAIATALRKSSSINYAKLGKAIDAIVAGAAGGRRTDEVGSN